MAGMLYYPCIPTGVDDGDPEVQEYSQMRMILLLVNPLRCK